MKNALFLLILGTLSLESAHSDTAVRVINGDAGGSEIGICRVPAVRSKDVSGFSNVWSCPHGQETTLQALLDEIKTPLQRQIDQNKRDNDALAATIDSLKKQLNDLQAERKSMEQKTSQTAE